MDPRKDRLVHKLFGAGTLVWGEEFSMRFELDTGAVLAFRWAKLGVGTPAFQKKRNRKEMPDEQRNWMTIETRDGEVFMFRKEGALAPPAELSQMALL